MNRTPRKRPCPQLHDDAVGTALSGASGARFFSGMSDDKSKKGSADRERINVQEPYEVEYWSKKFGVTPDQLKAAVQKAGVMATDVEKELKRS